MDPAHSRRRAMAFISGVSVLTVAENYTRTVGLRVALRTPDLNGEVSKE